MKIPVFAGATLPEFLKKAREVGEGDGGGGERWKVYAREVPTPARCPKEECQFEGRLRRNGSYTRQVIEGMVHLLVVIFRFRCRLCGSTVSCPYSFLVPYRRFTGRLICQGIERYGDKPTSYRETSADLSVYEEKEEEESTVDDAPAQCKVQPEDAVGGKEGFCPVRATVFSWVDFLCKRIEKVLQQVEKELVLQGFDMKKLRREREFRNKNASKAGAERYERQREKPRELDKLTYGLAAGRELVGGDRSTMEKLRAYFLKSAERCLDLLTDVSVVLPITQTSEHPLR
jgi:hypothetical protein